MNQYFLDTEFIEAGAEKPLVLLSIGLVDEVGNEYYAENSEANLETANDWVKKNVIPHMHGPVKSRAEIAKDVLAFMPPGSKEFSVQGEAKKRDKPVVWGYFADYDWVIFAQLFGTMVDMPRGYPYYCRDLKQWADQLKIPSKEFPKQMGTEHHALADAQWNFELYKYLRENQDVVQKAALLGAEELKKELEKKRKGP